LDIRLRVCGFFKRTILNYIEKILNAKIESNSVEIYVRVRFKEVGK